MSINYLIQDDSNYLEARQHLLGHNYFVNVLSLILRRQLGLPDTGLSNLSEVFEWERKNKRNFYAKYKIKTGYANKSKARLLREHRVARFKAETDKDCCKPIVESIEAFHYLNLEYHFLKTMVLGGTDFYFENSDKVYMITSSHDPIVEPGIYVKYDPTLPVDEWLKLKDEADKAYSSFEIYVPVLKKYRRNSYKKAQAVGENNLELYKLIEQKLFQLYQTDHLHAYLKFALEQLSNELNISIATLKKAHDIVQKHYNLPKSTEVSSIKKVIVTPTP